MPTRLEAVVFDAADPSRLARFWADALGWVVTLEEPDEVAVEAAGTPAWADGGPPPLVFVPVGDPKVAKNRLHLDLCSSSRDGQRATVARLLELGARPVDIGQGDTPWVVLADPEGNELCVLEPRDQYHDTLGVASVVLDCADPAALAPFWAEATGWPVVEQSPAFASLRHPEAPATWLELLAVPDEKVVKNRVHVDVAPYPADGLDAEVARLERAGARRVDVGQRDVSWVVLTDPQGNELCVLSPR